MTERKTISKEMRFEVFKRDSFKCQYCGKSAPEVILNVDHIMPVSRGGDNDITNLITSCQECNSGKSNIKLDDEAVIIKRKNQLDELQERREQIEMLYQWHAGLLNIENESADIVCKLWDELVPNYSINEHGFETIKRIVRKYGLGEVIESLKISTSQYLEAESGKFTNESVNKTFDYIEKICRNKKKSINKPYLNDLYYIRGILKKRFPYINEFESIQILETAYTNGLDIDDLKEIATEYSTKSYSKWKYRMNYFIDRKIEEEQTWRPGA